MTTLTATKEPPIVRGIKTAGIGKKGSKPLSAELAREIVADLKAGKVNPIAKGAFFAALRLKGISQQEMVFDEAFLPGTLFDPQKLVDEIAPDASVFVKDICVHILNGGTLDCESAYRLGKFLFSTDPGDGARGFIASALRVRYETPDEYAGLLRAMEETIEPSFRTKIPEGDPVIQLAEPFDGFDHSYLLTPLLADYIQTLGFRVVTMVGRNSGPKSGNTVLDLIKAMQISPIAGNSDLAKPKPPFGWYIQQANLSRAVDRWVDIRRQTIKRPFLSTLEKFLNPLKAKIIISSAFHPPYTEKMTTVAQRAGFPGTIVIRNGLEGGLAFPLVDRPVKMLCSLQRCEGDYFREEIEILPSRLLGFEIKTDEKLNQPSVLENARIIQQYKEKGTSGNALFDSRVKITCEGFKMAIDCIEGRSSISVKGVPKMCSREQASQEIKDVPQRRCDVA